MKIEAIFQPVDEFLEQFAGEKEVCLEIVGIAQSDVENRLQELLADGKRGDSAAVARHLHAMRGVVATFGCESLTVFLRDTEKSVEETATLDPAILRDVEATAAAFLESLHSFEQALREAN